jgi:hypothetical protein
MRDVEPQQILKLLRLHYRESCYRSVLHGLRINLWPAEADESPPPLSAGVLKELQSSPSDARVFERPQGNPVSWNDLYKVVQSRDFAALYASVPEDGSSTFTRLDLNLSDDLVVETTAGRRRVASFSATLELVMELRTSTMMVDRTSEYSSRSSSIAQSVSYSAEASFGQVQAFTVTPSDTGRVHLALQLTPKKDSGR